MKSLKEERKHAQSRYAVSTYKSVNSDLNQQYKPKKRTLKLIQKSKEIFERQRPPLKGPYTWSKLDEMQGVILDADQQLDFNQQEELVLAKRMRSTLIHNEMRDLDPNNERLFTITNDLGFPHLQILRLLVVKAHQFSKLLRKCIFANKSKNIGLASFAVDAIIKDAKSIVKTKKASALTDLFLGILPVDEVKYIVNFSCAFNPEDNVPIRYMKCSQQRSLGDRSPLHTVTDEQAEELLKWIHVSIGLIKLILTTLQLMEDLKQDIQERDSVHYLKCLEIDFYRRIMEMHKNCNNLSTTMKEASKIRTSRMHARNFLMQRQAGVGVFKLPPDERIKRYHEATLLYLADIDMVQKAKQIKKMTLADVANDLHEWHFDCFDPLHKLAALSKNPLIGKNLNLKNLHEKLWSQASFIIHDQHDDCHLYLEDQRLFLARECKHVFEIQQNDQPLPNPNQLASHAALSQDEDLAIEEMIHASSINVVRGNQELFIKLRHKMSKEEILKELEDIRMLTCARTLSKTFAPGRRITAKNIFAKKPLQPICSNLIERKVTRSGKVYAVTMRY